MNKSNFWVAYVLLLLAQLLISNFLHITPFIMLSILPVMVLCIPTRIKTPGAMLIAFASGLLIDWLSEGVLGLNALALVPVAFSRNAVIRLIFGQDLFVRGEEFSVRSNGFVRVALALFLAQSIFLLIYIWADGAGMRPLWFNAARFGASLGAGFLVSLLTLNVLASENRK